MRMINRQVRSRLLVQWRVRMGELEVHRGLECARRVRGYLECIVLGCRECNVRWNQGSKILDSCFRFFFLGWTIEVHQRTVRCVLELLERCHTRRYLNLYGWNFSPKAKFVYAKLDFFLSTQSLSFRSLSGKSSPWCAWTVLSSVFLHSNRAICEASWKVTKR